MAIHWIDMAIIVAYLVGITGVGLWFSRHQRDSSAGCFLAGRSLGWVTVGLALFATNISTVHLTGLAGAGFSQGMVVGNFEWLAPFLLILLGPVFAPFYFRTRIATLPEYLEGRYGPASRTVLAFMAVIGALFIHIGVTLYAGAEVMKTLIDFPAFGVELITRQWGIPFMLQAWILFVICNAAYVVVSLLTPPPRQECVDRYCWPNPLAVLTERRIGGITDPRGLALLLVLVMAGCYCVFA